MTDLDALYRAVLAHPGDDTPRLIYADALEESGEGARAAFVRAQVDLARAEEYDPAAVRARYFAEDNRAAVEWFLGQAALPGGLDWAADRFRRGFLGAVDARDGAAFVAGAEGLFAAHPVEALKLGALRAAEVKALAGCPWLARLVRLSLPAGLGQALARRLLNSPHLENLAELDIGPMLTSRETAAVVVGSRAFRRLRSLSYRDEQRGGAMLTALTRATDPPPLKKLDLAGNRIAAERLAELVAAPVMRTVEALDLSDNNLGVEGIAVLAAAVPPALRSLHLIRVGLRDDGARALAEGGLMNDLRSLALSENNLGPAAADALAASPGVAGLRVLDVRDNRLGNAGAAALAASPHLANLILLDLAGNGISDAGAAALAASPHLGGLVALDLYGNPVLAAAAARLRERFGERVIL